MHTQFLVKFAQYSPQIEEMSIYILKHDNFNEGVSLCYIGAFLSISTSIMSTRSLTDSCQRSSPLKTLMENLVLIAAQISVTGFVVVYFPSNVVFGLGYCLLVPSTQNIWVLNQKVAFTLENIFKNKISYLYTKCCRFYFQIYCI